MIWKGALLGTCHETVHMEEGHDEQGSIPVCQLVRCGDVVQAGCKVGMRQRDTLGLGCSTCMSSILTRCFTPRPKMSILKPHTGLRTSKRV